MEVEEQRNLFRNNLNSICSECEKLFGNEDEGILGCKEARPGVLKCEDFRKVDVKVKKIIIEYSEEDEVWITYSPKYLSLKVHGETPIKSLAEFFIVVRAAVFWLEEEEK